MLVLGWRGMFITIGALGILIVLAWLRVYRDPTLREQMAIKGENVEPPAPVSEKKAGWGQLFRQRNTYFMVIGAFGIFYTVWVYLTWLPSYLETSRGFSLSTTGWLASVPFLCGIAGVLFGGFLSGLLIRRGVSPVMSRKIPIAAGAALAAGAVLPVAYVENTPLAITLLSLGYFAAQVPIGCLWTLASDVAEPHQVASLGAIQNFGGFLGAALAPIVTGAILDGTGGNYNYVFLVGGVLLLIGGASYLFFVQDRRSATV
jgi:cyanate permease